ncbi:MAG: nickel-dependent hydrogenase large subunit [Chloroflexales bacterium]|nr:nickel-dependent hydrogenase large subunit [Chloroflexales bacterium]
MSYTLALGPFAAAWRGPQRFVLKIDGEHVTDVDYQSGYNERECAARLTRLSMDQALHLVTRICGTCSHAHALAFCQAIENLLELEVPARSSYLRCAVAEVERITSHLGALVALFDALGQKRFSGTLNHQRTLARQVMHLLSGSPILPDICLPGGARQDLDDQQRVDALETLGRLNQQLFSLIDQVINQRALLSRTVDVGVLNSSVAEQFGLRGPLARAAGLRVDVRLNQPYAAYHQFPPRLITQEGGDVYARLVVLLLETLESVKLAEQALQNIPGGSWQGRMPKALRVGEARAAVEAPRGALYYRLESNGRRLTAVTIDAPRQLDRLLARALLTNTLVDNITMVVLSTDPCVACAEC